MKTLLQQKALPEGFVLEWGRYPYRIDKCFEADGFGYTYRATVLAPESEIQQVVIREFFMVRCCSRGDDRAEMVCGDDIEATVNDTLTRHAENLLLRRKVVEDLPSLITIIDVFEANGTYYHVAELLEGDTLEDYIAKTGPLTPIETRGILIDVFNAVRRLHAHNILHTAICPANIRFKNGKAVLTHLYAALHFNEDGEQAVSFPSLNVNDGFSAPELYGPLENFLPQVDIYSLAATIIFCITGKRPPSAMELTEEKLIALLPANISKSMLSALLHATVTSLNERTPTVTSFREELDINYEVTPVAPPESRRTAIGRMLKKGWNYLKSFFPHSGDETTDDADDAEPEMTVEEIESSMSEAYPRLVVMGGLTILVIIALLVSIFVIF